MPLLTERRIVGSPDEITAKFRPLHDKALLHGGPDAWTFDWSVHNANVHRPENEGKFMECPREILEFFIEELFPFATNSGNHKYYLFSNYPKL